MPGHKGRRIFDRYGYGKYFKDAPEYDITEIPGADNLFRPESIIRETMDKYRKLYDSRESYLLINGSSCGIIASILASVPRGGKIIMARNCHKAVFNALELGDIEPVYVYPEEVADWGMTGAVPADEIVRALEENPDAYAAILPSPNYYGICSDISQIADVIHERGGVLIVDQAHGAHLKLFEKYCGGHCSPYIPARMEDRRSFDHLPASSEGKFHLPASGLDKFSLSDSGADQFHLPASAETSGADLVINSTHKTLASFTQTAVLNVMTDRVDLEVLEDKLQQMESSSPSYILMSTLDINADMMLEHGKELFKEWEKGLIHTYERLRGINGLRTLECEGLDMTKINLDFSGCSIADGLEAERLLNERNIFPELVTGPIVMCMTGVGNGSMDYDMLVNALKKICRPKEDPVWDASPKNSLFKEKTIRTASHSKTARKDPLANSTEAVGTLRRGLSKGSDENPWMNRTETADTLCSVHRKNSDENPWMKHRKMVGIPRSKEKVHLNDAPGRVCAASIIPYPPGIPIICQGEIIDAETAELIIELLEAGEKVIGVGPDMRIYVGK